MLKACLLLILLTSTAYAHELSLSQQFLKIRRQNDNGRQTDVAAIAKLNQKFDAGLLATTLNRFDQNENRLGAVVLYRPWEALVLEARYLQGSGNEILPRKHATLSAYYGAWDGLSPFLIYRDISYSQTRLHNATLGMEIEKWNGVILIPQLMRGKATFQNAGNTREIWNLGLKAVYYREQLWSVFAFGFKGKEASQGIIGASNLLVDTLTGGVGASFYFTPAVKGELIVDHTNYKQLKNSFLTSIFNLTWAF